MTSELRKHAPSNSSNGATPACVKFVLELALPVETVSALTVLLSFFLQFG